MERIPVIAIFDIGKTNKKLFLFDEQYRIVFEESVRLEETTDEDGDACEDLPLLRRFVQDTMASILEREEFLVKAVNFSAYGASMVFIDETGRPLTPLYSYLKPYPASLHSSFYDQNGGEAAFSLQSASPILGSLNSGMQLYRLKYQQPALFRKTKYALHLPQYISFLLTGTACSDITSIGCHTNLWDFRRQQYHSWTETEGVRVKLAPLQRCDKVQPGTYLAGTGLHDSSAALIPYLVQFGEPFLLISTGTWCISLNPFNDSPLTDEELRQDCLCYLSFQGRPVKASRLFAGRDHELQVARIAEHFNKKETDFHTMPFDDALVQKLQSRYPDDAFFSQRELPAFETAEEAYHQLMIDIIAQQRHATGLVLHGDKVKNIFVDGGFSKNALYMNLLAAAFPEMTVFAADVAQASAIGAAMVIHEAWNRHPIPGNLVSLTGYTRKSVH
ncbi:FGGY-family carbohydrate kinase [Chitinophaga barathri]|uniref:Carbohydrate kinase n=1 Tax=Chitinophaga barathri TaxID=1647451 RepID=A0A3N4MHG8_9BACT|nr:FGGY family carbohydrate kinase [Chitinophaga barathri]RPD41197.1 carbohydrate kinase [Chitinophaga barathri]